MAEFLIELYVSRADRAAVETNARRARLAAEELTREGRPVQFIRSIFVPEDETCFYLYEANTAADVEEAAQRASFAFEHVRLTVAGRAGGEESP